MGMTSFVPDDTDDKSDIIEGSILREVTMDPGISDTRLATRYRARMSSITTRVKNSRKDGFFMRNSFVSLES